MKPLRFEQNGITYYNITAAGAPADDNSALFLAGEQGYYIEEGIYNLDEPTFRRVIKTPCMGKGAIRWKGFKVLGDWNSNPDQFTGILEADKVNDPLYAYMGTPSEAITYLRSRVNPTQLLPAVERFGRILTIGALYTRDGLKLPDDAKFTLCIGRTTMCLRTKTSNGWYLASDIPVPAKPNHIYYLPWSLEHVIGAGKLPEDAVKLVDDHYEITLTGYDLNGGDKKDDRIEGAVLHFWGENIKVENGADVLGMVCSFEAWVKEEEWADALVMAIGADWREDVPRAPGEQAFSGFNFALTTQPRVVYGHNVGPKAYDEVMDSETVQKLIRLK